MCWLRGVVVVVGYVFEVAVDFDGEAPLWRMVRMFEVWVMVCMVRERSVRKLWASDFSFRARSSVMMCVKLSMINISVPEESSFRGEVARASSG